MCVCACVCTCADCFTKKTSSLAIAWMDESQQHVDACRQLWQAALQRVWRGFERRGQLAKVNRTLPPRCMLMGSYLYGRPILPSQCKSHSCQRASDVDFYVDVGEKLFEHSKTILAALESRAKEERGFTKSKIELQMDNNTLKARHKELTVDTSLLICTLEVPKSCTAVHSSRLLRAAFEKDEPRVEQKKECCASWRCCSCCCCCSCCWCCSFCRCCSCCWCRCSCCCCSAATYYPRCIERRNVSVISVKSGPAIEIKESFR